MPYETIVDLPKLLQTVLSLLENTDYVGKHAKSVQDLKKCLLNVVAELSALQAQSKDGSAED